MTKINGRHKPRGKRGKRKNKGKFNGRKGIQQGNYRDRREIIKITIPVNCCECDKPEPKYKCPPCLKKYCSAVCWRAHKERCEFLKIDGSQSTAANEPLVTSNSREKCTRKYNYEFPTADTVPLEKLMQIKDNETIRNMLGSKKIRELITTLDDAQDPKYAFREIIKNPQFKEFSNAVLDIVG